MEYLSGKAKESSFSRLREFWLIAGTQGKENYSLQWFLSSTFFYLFCFFVLGLFGSSHGILRMFHGTASHPGGIRLKRAKVRV
jgi:hypothetical protein